MSIFYRVGLRGVLILVVYIFSFHTLNAETATSTDTAVTSAAEVTATSSRTVEIPVHNAAEVKERVVETFKDAPVMIEIARCESKYRQYTDNGNVLRGGFDGNMVGVFQFNEPIHRSEALSLGFDIDTLEGNIAYAEHLYNTSGTDPWVSSLSCWNISEEGSEDAEDGSLLAIDLRFGEAHPQVRVLQQLLNEAGFVLADNGPGSPGEETTKFGNLTRASVRTFQCEVMNICSGTEYATGYGLVNRATRNALLTYEGDGMPSKQAKQNSENEMTAKDRAAILAQINELMKLIAQLQQLLVQRV